MKASLTSNPIQKLLSICFAIIIWALAPSPNKDLIEVKFFVPVSYVNLPKHLEIISVPPQSISVSVEISRNELASVHPSMFQAAIDLEKAVQGAKEFEITQKALSAPNNVKILEIEPQVLELAFEEIIEKELPIRPVLVGEPSQGYVLEEITMIPETVRVKGLISVLSKVEELQTKAINIDNISSNMEMLVHILFPKNVAPTEPKPEYYAAHINVGSEPINVRFLNIPIGIINHEYVTRINPRSFNLLLRGPRSLMENFQKQDIQAFINLEGYSPGNYKIKEPIIRLPPEIQVQKVWPPIDIWVKKLKID